METQRGFRGVSSREDTEKTAVCKVRREGPSYGHLELGLGNPRLPAGWLQPRGRGPSAARHSAPADEHGTPGLHLKVRFL